MFVGGVVNAINVYECTPQGVRGYGGALELMYVEPGNWMKYGVRQAKRKV